MDLVEFNGLMEKSMKGTGDKVFKMEKVRLLAWEVYQDKMKRLLVAVLAVWTH